MADEFELLEGSLLDVTTTGTRKVTSGIVWGLTVDSDPDPEVIWRAKTAVEAAGFNLGAPLPGHTNLLVQRMTIRGYTNDGCMVQIFHELPSFDIATAAVIRTRTYVSAHESNMYTDATGARRPIEIAQWTGTINGQVRTIERDAGTISRLMPMRSILSTVLSFGQPINGGENMVGYVNNGNWKGIGTGYWMMSRFETDISRYQGYYQQRAEAITRINQDWSETVILRNDRSGKFINVVTGDLTFLNAADYINGLTKVPGATKVGPYPLIPSSMFTSVFGT